MSDNLAFHTIGQNKIFYFLNKQLHNNKISSAYLFSGIRHLGKEKAARYFLKVLMCQNSKEYPCGECDSCVLINNNRHPDFYEIRLEDGKKEIVLDQIKHLKRSLGNKPFKGKCKAVIISAADVMNNSAANALLKLLEEPYGMTVFVLLNNKQRKILPTIISRCQTVNFHPVGTDAIYKWLIKKGINSKTAQEIADAVLYKPALAEVFSNDKELWASKKMVLINMVQEILSGHHDYNSYTLNTVDWTEKQAWAKEWLENYKFIWHNILLLKLDIHTYLSSYYNLAQLHQFISGLAIDSIISKIDDARDAIKKITYNVPGNILIQNLLYN